MGLLAAAAAATGRPRVAWAQAPTRTFRLGVLQAGRPQDTQRNTDAFFTGLAEEGFVEGRNLVIKTLYAGGRLDRLPALAAEIVAFQPDLIFAPAAPATAAVKALTTTIPIVFCYVNEPVALGFAQNLAHPGGNLTGMSNFSVDIAGKRIELLREVVPGMKRIGAWYNSEAVNDAVELRAVEAAAARFDLDYRAYNAHTPAEYDAAAAATRAWGADAVYINSNPAALANRHQIIALMAASKTPAMYFIDVFVADGGLMCYAANFLDLAHRAAGHAVKILRGANPAELPIEQPVKVDLSVNLKTANALGLTIPQSIMLRADAVIE